MFARDMHGRIIRFLLTGLVLVLGLFPSGATASSYDSIVAFGDSLSQTEGGDYDDRWIEGEVWVEYLKSRLEVTLGHEVTLTNTASGENTTSGVFEDAENYTGSFDNALVTVWAGGADLPYLAGVDKPGTADYTAAADNLNDAIEVLIGKGARNFVILNLPNIGVVPNVTSTDVGSYESKLPNDFLYSQGFDDAAAYASWWSQGFNDELDKHLGNLKITYGNDYNFYTYDTYTMLSNMVDSPGAYGFESKDALFYDGLHLSTGVHAYIADQVYAQVVPLPASLLFLGSGLLGLIGFRRVMKG